MVLGWWTGWYNDDVDIRSTDSIVDLVEHNVLSPSSLKSDRPSRYIVYLDGVGQSGQSYTPDVVEFIEALQSALPPNQIGGHDPDIEPIAPITF